jgi:hypothetical protein
MLKNQVDLKIKKKELNNSFIYYEQHKKHFGGIIEEYDIEKNIYNLDGKHQILAQFDEDGYLIGLFYLVKNKKNFIKGKKLNYQYSEFRTKHVKRLLLKNKVYKLHVKRAIKKMNDVFSKHYYIRIINRSMKLVSYLSIIDAFFVGTHYNMNVNGHNYKCDYWFIDQKLLIKQLLKDKELYDSLYFVYDMLVECDYRLINKYSNLFILLKHIKDILLKYYKENK